SLLTRATIPLASWEIRRSADSTRRTQVCPETAMTAQTWIDALENRRGPKLQRNPGFGGDLSEHASSSPAPRRLPTRPQLHEGHATQCHAAPGKYRRIPHGCIAIDSTNRLPRHASA